MRNPSDHASKDIAYHDTIADHYDRVVVAPRWSSIDALFRPLSDLIPACGNMMLDVGTGTGHMLRRFASRFERVTAVDHSEQMLRKAQESARRAGLSHIEFRRADAIEFARSDDRSFDLISCVGFLHHLRPVDLPDLLGALAKLLSPTGSLVISEPIAISSAEPRAIEWWNREYRQDPQHYAEMPAEPDEAPLDIQFLGETLRAAQLKVCGEGRGWEIFPRRSFPDALNTIAVEVLHRFFGSRGPVYWACCRRA